MPKSRVLDHPNRYDSPLEVLRSILEEEDSENIAQVSIVVTMEDGTMGVRHSATNGGDLAADAVVLQDYSVRAIRGEL